MSALSRAVVIRGARVIDGPAHAAPHRDLLIAAGRIEAIGPPGLDAPDDARVVDATDRLVIPGLVNAHTHGHGSLGKGIGDRWTLELLLNAGAWLAGGRDPEHKYLAAQVAALEMIRKGCTACYDLHVELPAPSAEGMDAVARGYRDAGLRAVLAPMVADRSFYEAIPGLMEALPVASRSSLAGPGPGAGEPIVATLAALLRDWSFDRDEVRPALAPTVPLHCSDGFIADCRDLARGYDVGLHMHLAESKVQAVAGIERYGKTLTAHLDGLDFLGPSFTGAHCVWLDGDDIARLGDRGASVAHNPGSNLRLGSGIAAAREMRAAGVTVGIGTDGGTCSDNQNMFEAMRLASFVSRVRSHDPGDWLATDEVLAMATEGSARILGFGDDIGRIAPGAYADLVLLDLGHVNYWPLNDPVNQLVHTEEGGAVRSVMVGGRMVLDEGAFTTVDVVALRARIERAVETLHERNAAQRRLSEGLATAVGQFCVGLARRPYHAHAMASAGESPGGPAG